MLKKRYDKGDLVQLARSSRAKQANLYELKPPTVGAWDMLFERTELMIVIRHEEGGGTDRFKGSILTLTHRGFVWIDSRDVTCVRNGQAVDPEKSVRR